MPFNSIPFILFLALVLIINVFVPQKLKLQFLFSASICFYACGSLLSAVTVIIVISITYVFSICSSAGRQYALLAILAIVSMFLLGKWGVADWSRLVNKNNGSFPFIYALGLSFYSLQAIAYIVDVKDGTIKADRNFFRLGLFLSFFAQSAAGPIHRYTELSTQFRRTSLTPEIVDVTIGLKTMLWGYVCKLIIADKIGLAIMPVLAAPENENGLVLLLASFFYSYQLYFDFFGYSLIAIGVARLFGIKLNENFNNPYSARTLKEFWRRWHITLSNWLRDYVYIRLGGRGQSVLNFSFAITVTFFVSAIWHGLTFNYILWGLLHATLYLGEYLLSKFIKANDSWFIRFSQRLIVFLQVSILWIVFRTTDLDVLELTFKKIISLDQWSLIEAIRFVYDIYFAFILALFAILALNINKHARSISVRTPGSYRELSVEIVYIVFCAVSILVFGDLGTQEFLYFKF